MVANATKYGFSPLFLIYELSKLKWMMSKNIIHKNIYKNESILNNKNAKNLITHICIGYIFHYMLSDKLQI